MSFDVIQPDELTVTPMQGKPAVKITVEYGDGDSANVILSPSQARTLANALTAALASPLLDFAHTNPFDNSFAHGDRVRFEFSGVTCEGQIISIGDDDVATIGGHGRNYEIGVANLRHVTS